MKTEEELLNEEERAAQRVESNITTLKVIRFLLICLLIPFVLPGLVRMNLWMDGYGEFPVGFAIFSLVWGTAWFVIKQYVVQTSYGFEVDTKSTENNTSVASGEVDIFEGSNNENYPS